METPGTLNYHFVLIKWKEAWESVGSGAGRDSCPQHLLRVVGEHRQLYCNCGYFHKTQSYRRTGTRAEGTIYDVYYAILGRKGTQAVTWQILSGGKGNVPGRQST